MRYLFRLSIVMSLFIVAFIVHIPVQALDTTITVCDFQTLSDAVDDANNGGGTIDFNCGTATIIFTSELIISNDVTINGGGVITFDGADATRFFTVNSGASLTLNGLTLQNGNAFLSAAGAIVNDGALTISNSTLSDNSATYNAGAIDNNGALTISNSTLSNNSAGESGGAIYSDGGGVTISNSTFTDNSAGNSGGVIYIRGTMTITDSTLSNNLAQFGGAILNDLSIITISNSTLLGNSASDDAGAIYNGNGATTISNSTLSGNSATDQGGAILNTDGTVTISYSTLSSNVAPNGSAILNILGSIMNSEDSHYENNICVSQTSSIINDNGGNTQINATGCPGSAPIALDVSALSCNGDNAEFTINAGDGDFTVDGTSGNFPPSAVPVGLVTLTGPATWTDVTVTERGVNPESINFSGITCPSGVIIPPVIPPAPSAPAVTVLGCALDNTDGVEVANAPDNTYCRVLMKNGGVVSYSGAVPRELISLGVILAVDVYRLQGGMSQNTFPDYARVCLAGQGRLFYMDGRNAPRVSIELASESVDGLMCGWIPAPGTVILTN